MKILKTDTIFTRNNESLESIISKVDNIYIVGINSDLFLLRRRIEIPTTKLVKCNVFYSEIDHDHDDALEEYEQLGSID
jgi:hypothetical protein